MVATGFDPGTIVIASFKYRWRAGVVFLGFIGIALAVCLVMKTQYTATAAVLVKVGRELVYRPEIGAGASMQAADRDETMVSMIAIMGSPAMARQAIEVIGLARLYPDLARSAGAGPQAGFSLGGALNWLVGMNTPPEDKMTTAVRLFDRKLSVEIVKRTGIVNVSFTATDPQLAALGANTVVALFQKQAGKIFDNPNLGFMQSMVDGQRASLDTAQAALDAYRQKYGVYALDDQISALLKQKTEIDTSLKSDAAHISELQILIATMTAQRSQLPQRVVVSSEATRIRAVDDSESQLLALRIQERQMATKFAQNYPPLAEVRNQIALAEQSVKAARAEPAAMARTALSDTYQALQQSLLQRQAELDSYAGRQEAMKTQLTSIDESLTRLSDRQRTLAALQQDVTLRTDEVKSSYDKLAEARAVDGLNGQKPSSFSLYQEAMPPDPANPSKPQPLLYTLLAAVIGTLAGVTTIFISFVLDRSFLTPELAGQRLGLPVLGVVDYRRNLAKLGRAGVLEAIGGGGTTRELSHG